MKGIYIYENHETTSCLRFDHNSQLLKFKKLNGKGLNECHELSVEGTVKSWSQAICNKDDTYDFETGALIALMKMCGVDKVVRACNEAFSEDTFKTYATKYERELNTLKKDFDKVKDLEEFYKKNYEEVKEHYRNLSEENITLKKENKELHKNIDELFESEQHSKTELGRLYFEKHRLEEKVEKLKLDCEKIQYGYNDSNILFYGGRQNGKQYTFLVDLFKKIPKDKVQAAYVAAYKESLIWCTSQPSIRDQLDSLIESSKYAMPYVDKWLYRIPTKREEMWEKIFALHKEKNVIIKVKKEDVNTFLHELENKVPGITWASGFKIFETKYTIGDIYEELKTHDVIYFRLHEDNKLSYASDPHIYLYRENNHIEYLPPMRWDLFKKGRVVVKVDSNNYEDFYNKCEAEIGRKPHYSCEGTFTVYYSKGTFHTRPYDEKIPYKHKVVNWEDVR